MPWLLSQCSLESVLGLIGMLLLGTAWVLWAGANDILGPMAKQWNGHGRQREDERDERTHMRQLSTIVRGTNADATAAEKNSTRLSKLLSKASADAAEWKRRYHTLHSRLAGMKLEVKGSSSQLESVRRELSRALKRARTLREHMRRQHLAIRGALSGDALGRAEAAYTRAEAEDDSMRPMPLLSVDSLLETPSSPSPRTGRYCATPEAHSRLAILGVFTAEEHTERRALARTWLSQANGDSGVLARFVARGLGSTETLDREARQLGDVIFVHGPSSMPRNNGPLLTLILWLECAVHAWPRATLIGKADDDIWVHVGATAAHLRGSLDALRSTFSVNETAPINMYWGLMETYGWDFVRHRPIGFGYKFTKWDPTCKVEKNDTFVYPVHFAKGPMYFLSSPIARQLVSSPGVRSYAETAIASANSSRRERTLPWEDIFTGLALTRIVRAQNLAFVHMGSRTFGEGYGAYASSGFSSSTLLYHVNSAASRERGRYARMHKWALANHCALNDTARNLTVTCKAEMRSCAGATWQRCLYSHDHAACPVAYWPRWKTL